MSDNLSIVTLAAGLGTRMVSRKAKVLHEAGGLTLVEHVVNSSAALTSPERIVIVVGHQAERVAASFGRTGRTFRPASGAERHRACVSTMRAGGFALGWTRACGVWRCPPSTPGNVVQSRTAAQRLECSRDSYHHGSGRSDRIWTGAPRQNGDVLAIVEEKVATPEQKALRQITSGSIVLRGIFFGNIYPDRTEPDFTRILPYGYRRGTEQSRPSRRRLCSFKSQ